MKNVKHLDTIIIGGGIAGLSAALHLAERGIKPVIFEANEKFIGGRLAGGEFIEVNGWKFRAEHGVHGIWSPYRNFQAMLARNQIRPVFVPARDELWVHKEHNSIRKAAIGNAIRHSIFPAPLHYFQLFLRPSFLMSIDVRDWLKLFHTWSLLIMSLGVDPFAEDQPLDGHMLGDTIRSWSPALRAFFTGLARNGLSTHSDEIPLAGFLAFLRFYTTLRRDTWSFSYLPQDGGTAVCEPIASRINALGCQILFGKKVTKLEKVSAESQVKDGQSTFRWQITVEDEIFTADDIIIAVDSAAASTLVKNSFGENDLYFPRSLPNAIIRLWFDREPKSGPEGGMFTGDFVMHNFFWLERIYQPYKEWNQATGGSAVEVHIYGPEQKLAEPAALLLTEVISDIYRAYPELKGHLITQQLQYNESVHTLPSLGSKELHPGIISRWEHIYFAGDWVRDSLPSFFLERACATGIKAANQVLKAHQLKQWTLIDYLPPEPFAGWIQDIMIKARDKRRLKRQQK